MDERVLILEVALVLHDGGELRQLIDEIESPQSDTLEIARILGITDSRIEVIYMASHDDPEDDPEEHLGTHIHSEQGRIIRIRLDDPAFVDFVFGDEMRER